MATLGPLPAAHAKHGYYFQSCTAAHSGTELETRQAYAGPYLLVSATGKGSVQAEYFPREDQTGPEDGHTLMGLRVISLADGPESIRSEGGYTTRLWKRSQGAVVVFASPSLGEVLGAELRVGDRLALDCQVTVIEPGQTN